MMRVVGMFMLVLHRLMCMRVRMSLGQMQPDADCHQRAAREQGRGDALVQYRNCDQRAQEWRGRKIRRGTRGAQTAQRQHEQHQAQSVAQKSEHSRQPPLTFARL